LALHLVRFVPTAAAQWLLLNLENAILINIVLAVFNFVPVAAPGWRANRGGSASKGTGNASFQA
jgi:hypothetical protein